MDWLGAVQTTVVAEDVKLAVAKFLVAANIAGPELLEGVEPSEIMGVSGAPAGMAERALIRRGLIVASATAGAKRSKASASAIGGNQNYMGSSQLATLQSVAGGSDSSALALANILQTGKHVDASAKLSASSMTGLPFTLQADQSIWQLFEAENSAALNPQRKAFTYVDLTVKGLLPLWVLPEAIGGRMSLPGEMEDLIPGANQSTLTVRQLAAALGGVSASPRFFRNFAQWSGAYWRATCVAVPMGQWTWSQSVTHCDTVARLWEEEKHTSSSYTALLYDDMVRKSWARRAERCDPTFDMEVMTKVIDAPILAAARSRILMVLGAAGISDTGASTGTGQNQIARPDGSVEQESALAKQTAAADALVRRASQATKELAKQQEALGKMTARIQMEGAGDPGMSNRAVKRARQDDFRDGKGEKGKSQGKKGSKGGGRDDRKDRDRR